MNFFSKNLRYLRERKKLEQQDLAEQLNIPQSTLSCWENGIRTPKVEQIIDIANYFGVGIDIVSRDYSKNDEYIIKEPNSKINENDKTISRLNALYSKLRDLPEDKQKIIFNVTESIIKEIDEKNDNN